MSRIDDRQIKDGNIGLPDLDHYNWTVTDFVSGTYLPSRISGTSISGDHQYFVVQEIFRDIDDVPYRELTSYYYNNDGSLRWKIDNYIIRQNGYMISTSGTIVGENGD